MGAEHHRGKDEEEEALKAQEDEEDDCCWRREGTALWTMEGHGNERARLGLYKKQLWYHESPDNDLLMTNAAETF